MSDATYDYCKIFVRHIEVDAAKEILTHLFGGVFHRHSMPHGKIVLDVRRNPDTPRSEDSGDDFVMWPVLIEVDAEDENDGHMVVDVVSRIIRILWDSSYWAVVACDFESELPWGGGIQRLDQ